MIFGGKDAWVWWDWVTRTTDEILDALRQHLWYTLLAVASGSRSRCRWASSSSVAAGLAWSGAGRRRDPLHDPVAGGLRPARRLAGPLQPVDGDDPPDRLHPLHPHPRRDRRPRRRRPGRAGRRRRAWATGPRSASCRSSSPSRCPRSWRASASPPSPRSALVTVTAVIGQGGFGRLIYDGLFNFFRTPLTVGAGADGRPRRRRRRAARGRGPPAGTRGRKARSRYCS